ncbi:hypothetical protein AMJ39_07345 [candidate division TA06 bacterium DG_24]|uniref:histidine kinase n=3 Tax=Bacteria division TA06 TaxID=1156500 RepID=A0A0S8JKY1_UNCT6|nr:MAG: hypothetical protein AMJ39_07345 [candidate division TA06 bacterium DG_24]KPK68501.1 MAG: hypothetical protein AMJ82_08110 [candidate division TA06 bacterium SM23_40]KPL10423.1 MAG: hypothetical protein AMJ71_03170 [candidate division TA06 bacterium SM1_40]
MRGDQTTDEARRNVLKQLRRRVAELERSEAERRQLEERLRDIADNASGWFWEVDAAGKYTYSSAYVEQILGYRPDELLNRHFYDLLHPEDRDERAKAILEVFAFRQPFCDYVSRALHKNGTTVWISTSGVPIVDAKGTLLGYRGIDTDVTHKIRMERALRESEEGFRALTESTSDWIWEVDADGVYTYASPKVRELLGYEPEEIVGRTLFDFLPPEEAERVRAEFSVLVQRRRAFERMENSNIRKDGRLVLLETSGVPILDDTGELVGFRGIDRDVTERRWAEEALAKRTYELRERVKELNCLFAISRLMADPETSLDELLRGTIDLITPSWQYPDITCARIALGGKEYATAEWLETRWRLSADIYIEGNQVGVVEVGYLEEAPEADDGPFLREERHLIDAIAELLGSSVGCKRAEKALRESEERFRALTESTSDWVWEVDSDWIYTYASPKVRDLLGYKADEVIGRTPFDFMLPKVGERVGGEFARIAQARLPVEKLERWCLHKDGALVLLQTSGVPILGASGELLGYRGIDRDITELKEAEETLHERSRELQTIFDSVPAYIFTKDRLGRYLRVNKALAEATGIPVEEWEGKTDAEVEPVYAQRYQSDDREVMESGRAKRNIVEPLKTAQGTRWARADKIPMRDRSGNVVGLIGVAVDITAQKRAEERLKAYSERLEEMVEERTRELQDTQEQLVRKEKLSVLGQLAGTVGHELRNPLGVISNAAYYLQMKLTDADEKCKKYLDLISSEVRNSTDIVSDLLDFSRAKPPKREEVSVSALVAQALERQPPPENVTLTSSIPPDLPPLFVDSRQIGQVLNNLVTNAYQAMSEGGTLTIGARAEGAMVHLSVADTGCGISDENMKRLFEPLFTTKERGIGLGLMVTKNLAEANGGKITVQSEEGKGSTFTVTLPMCKESPLASETGVLCEH